MYKLIINLKTYDEANDGGCVKIVKAVASLKNYAKEKKVEIILCPQFHDLKEPLKEKIKTFSQHIDDIEVGQTTGFVPVNSLKKIGVRGSLINHSEHRLKSIEIKRRIKKLNEAKMESCVCVEGNSKLKEIKNSKPNYIALELRSLIGGNISIADARPHLIEEAVKLSGSIPLLIGAGIKTKHDIQVGIKLGAKGILVASDIAKARNPRKNLKELLDGF